MAIFSDKKRGMKIELYPSSDFERNAINLVAGDMADVGAITKSQVILGTFLTKTLPSTEMGMFVLENLVRDGGSVKLVLTSLCAKMAAGTNWEPAYSNGYELLSFIDDKLLGHHIRVDWTNEAHHHMMDSFARFTESMEVAARRAKAAGSADSHTLEGEAAYAKDLLREWRSGEESGYAEPAANLTRLIRSNWETLQRNQMVWRCLTSLLDASTGWPDYVDRDGKRIHVRSTCAADLRLQTIDLIKRVTKAWEIEDAEKLEKSSA